MDAKSKAKFILSVTQDDIKECPNCGYKNEKKARFCTKCGVKLDTKSNSIKEDEMSKTIEFTDNIINDLDEEVDPLAKGLPTSWTIEPPITFVKRRGKNK